MFVNMSAWWNICSCLIKFSIKHHWFLLDHLVGIGKFRIIAYARMTPNGKTTTYVSITTTSCICLSFIALIWYFHWLFVSTIITYLFNKEPHCSSLTINLFCFLIIEYFLLRSHTLNKYSCSHMCWTTIQCK
jgi:hypothetical protein